MSDQAKPLILQGLTLAIVPALLLFPALAFLTVCPPIYGKTPMMALSFAFGCSWVAAIATLWKLKHRCAHDGAALVAIWIGIPLSVAGLALIIYGSTKSLHG